MASRFQSIFQFRARGSDLIASAQMACFDWLIPLPWPLSREIRALENKYGGRRRPEQSGGHSVGTV